MPQSGADTFELAATHTPGLAEFLAAHPGDYRILNMGSPNEAMMPGGLRRVGEKRSDDAAAIRRTDGLYAGRDPNQPLRRPRPPPPLLQLAAFALHVVRERGVNRVFQGSNELPHLQLVQDYRVIKGRDAIFAAMNDPALIPAKTVVLGRGPGREAGPTSLPWNGKTSGSIDRLSGDPCAPERAGHSRGH